MNRIGNGYVVTNDATLIDRIYEAAVIPERWADVMQRLTALSDSAFASLLVLRDNKMNFIGTPEAEKLIREYEALGRPDYNTRIARSLERNQFGFHTDLDIFTREEIDSDSFYRDFMRPRGVGWIAGAWVKPPTGELINFGVEGRFEKGPFTSRDVETLNALYPHLARAALWSSQLEMRRVDAMTQALLSIELPAAVLSGQGQLQAANDLFQKLLPRTVRDGRAHVALADASADKLLQDAIARLSSRDTQGQSRSIPVAAMDPLPPMIFHVLPVRGEARDVFARALALLVVTPVDRSSVPTAEVLQGLFDLTPAEARVARGIANASTIETIAVLNGVSRETVRTQLAAVLAKTGANRQAELVALLTGKGLRESSDGNRT